MGKKGTNGSGSSTRNPRPGKRPGKRAHTCPPSDPLAIPSHSSVFPTTTFHSTPFAPNKTGKGFCVCRQKGGKRTGKKEKQQQLVCVRGERIKMFFPPHPPSSFQQSKSFSDSIPAASSHNGQQNQKALRKSSKKSYYYYCCSCSVNKKYSFGSIEIRREREKLLHRVSTLLSGFQAHYRQRRERGLARAFYASSPEWSRDGCIPLAAAAAASLSWWWWCGCLHIGSSRVQACGSSR